MVVSSDICLMAYCTFIICGSSSNQPCYSIALDRCELKEMFKGMGVPVGERALSDMMERFDKDLGGTIEFDEFVEVMNELKPKKEPERWSWGSVQNAVGGMIKKTVTVEQHKLDCAYPLSDIQKVESINICSSESTDFFAHSSWVSVG